MKISERSQRRRLKKLDPDEVSVLPHRGEIIPCVIPEVYDGDTLTAIYLYQKAPMKVKIRLFGIDAPELRGEGVSRLESEVGELVGNMVRTWIASQRPSDLYLKIVRFDKYGGRFIGDVLKIIGPKKEPVYQSLSTLLLEAGAVVPFNGKKKKEKWTAAQLKRIKKVATAKGLGE